ncbi:hypothetical protein QLX08_005902 [Tetragonisca angustula]|uniref:Uncharacterized protein n=1 Tax=Tetragonisca angustula TaxID=166442 RepID=A0AAW0ZXX8_9HYME
MQCKSSIDRSGCCACGGNNHLARNWTFPPKCSEAGRPSEHRIESSQCALIKGISSLIMETRKRSAQAAEHETEDRNQGCLTTVYVVTTVWMKTRLG